MMDEKELILTAKQGDLDSFNRLVTAYQTRAFNLAYRILGDPDKAADATQEAFISAFRSLRNFRGGSFRAWILRIVTNACYDLLRHEKRRPATAVDFGDSPMGEVQEDHLSILATRQVDPEKAAEQAELAGAIQDCLDRLPLDFRAVVVLADVQGYDYQEVSEMIGKPLGTVKSRIARARARLRDCLQRYGELLPLAFRLEGESIQ